jgi:hypothetical protein
MGRFALSVALFEGLMIHIVNIHPNAWSETAASDETSAVNSRSFVITGLYGQLESLSVIAADVMALKSTWLGFRRAVALTGIRFYCSCISRLPL